jgi:hypothetical protein
MQSHRGLSPENRMDTLCIVEVKGNVTRAFACVISDKRASTMIPIIIRQVANNSTVWTDEHGSYWRLCDFFNEFGTVCHKYRFINDGSVNTQSFESLNNLLMCEIKSRRGV